MVLFPIADKHHQIKLIKKNVIGIALGSVKSNKPSDKASSVREHMQHTRLL